MPRQEIVDALGRLDDLTRRLRRECPWDREQDERTIVPHTVEEAYELADAANRGDDRKLLDELGDVLFQVHFLSLLLEERGAGDLAQVAEHIRTKLVRRHPHVFGNPTTDDASGVPGGARADTAGEVLRNWDQIKQGEPGRETGLFAEIPETLPGPLYARKVQRRAASSGFDPLGAEEAIQAVRAEADESSAAAGDRERSFEAVGDLLFAAVNVARKLRVDPELALHAAGDRFRARLEASAALAESEGHAWGGLDEDRQLDYYARARFEGA